MPALVASLVPDGWMLKWGGQAGPGGQHPGTLSNPAGVGSALPTCFTRWVWEALPWRGVTYLREGQRGSPCATEPQNGLQELSVERAAHPECTLLDFSTASSPVNGTTGLQAAHCLQPR